MLEVKNLSVMIGKLQILKDVSLTVKDGEKIGLIGPNGHGKSTTLNSISGLHVPKSGKITFNNILINGKDPREIIELGVVLVPEGGHLYPEMTVLENLLLGSYISRARKISNESLEKVYELFPRLKLLAKRKCNTLSGGEFRMVAIGRGIMGDPKLLMLDEPTLGLAPNLVEEIGERLTEVGKMGTSIILSEENIDLLVNLVDRVYFLENGITTIEGPTLEVLHSDHVKKIYIGL